MTDHNLAHDAAEQATAQPETEDGTGAAEQEKTCTWETGHLTGQDHRWQECPTYSDDEDDEATGA